MVIQNLLKKNFVMKTNMKFLGLALIILFSVSANAQHHQIRHDVRDIHRDTKDIRSDRHDIRADRKDIHQENQ